MNIDKDKLNLFRNSIPRDMMSEAFKYFYITKDECIRENLILSHMENAKKIALRKTIFFYEEEDDIEQIAYESLIKAVDSYNPFNGRYFSTHLDHVINRISFFSIFGSRQYNIYYKEYLDTINCIEKENSSSLSSYEKQNILNGLLEDKKINKANYKYIQRYIDLNEIEHLDNSIISNQDLEKMIVDKELKDYVEYLLNNFISKRSKELLEYWFGFHGRRYTFEELSKMYNISIQRISQIINRSLRKIYTFIRHRYNENIWRTEYVLYRDFDDIESEHILLKKH